MTSFQCCFCSSVPLINVFGDGTKQHLFQNLLQNLLEITLLGNATVAGGCIHDLSIQLVSKVGQISRHG